MPAKRKPTKSKRATKDKRGLRPIEARFLAAYRTCGSLTQAGEAVGCSRMTHYAWMRDKPEYREQFAEAHEEAVERLEAEARRRAVEGVTRVKFFMGEPIKWRNPATGKVEYYVEHEYSDSLLITLLKAHLPDKYRDNRSVEHRGFAQQTNVTVKVPPLADAPVELIEQLIDYLANREPGERPPPKLVESVPVPPEPAA